MAGARRDTAAVAMKKWLIVAALSSAHCGSASLLGTSDAGTPDPFDATTPAMDASLDQSSDGRPDSTADVAPVDAPSCPAGTILCGAACVDPSSDPSHCGSCGRLCSLAAAVAACSRGACTVNGCVAGFGDCDRIADNGCEVPLGTAANCGACGVACSGAAPLCDAAMGRCVSGCPAGTTLCSSACVDTSSSASHCGMCGNACSLPNATSSCSGGSCSVLRCNPGFADCDGLARNGCEVDTRSNVMNCGSCGAVCRVANGTPSCAASACRVASCAAGFADCDRSVLNGCETATATDSANCGGCGVSCSSSNATSACASGACEIVSCDPGFGDCDRVVLNGCEAPLVTASNCGACGVRCLGATPRCNAMTGRCEPTCVAPLVDCGGTCVDLNTDRSNCGRCGTLCGGAPFTTGTCVGGVCGCQTGYGDCTTAAGCETRLNTNANCGGCGVACALPNAATTSCASGTCAIVTCAADFADCDGMAANGCEARLDAVASCGQCRACPTGTTVTCLPRVGGSFRCVNNRCSPGWRGDCNGVSGDGYEVDLLNDTQNCGVCGRVCAPYTAGDGAVRPAQCSSGECLPRSPIC